MENLRIGILGTAGIARKNWRAIFDSGNSVVSAVASRDVSKAQQFIEDCQAKNPFPGKPAALGSYEELIHSSVVDAIYFPIPTGIRKEWVVKAANAGKHILCEKPCGLSLLEVQEMTDACARNNVQFMDGVMFMHNPRLQKMRGVLDDAVSVGEIRRIMSVFSFMGQGNFFDANIRVSPELEPSGCLGDLGWYCLRFGLWAMNWKLPREVRTNILSSHDDKSGKPAVPTSLSAELIFEGGASMGFYCAFTAEYQSWCQIVGTKGYLRVDGFVRPRDSHEPSFELNHTEQKVKVCDCPGAHDERTAMAQDSMMFRNFASQVASRKLNGDWPLWSLKTQQVMDACLKSAREGGRTMVFD